MGMQSKAFGDLITFTRASGATRFNELGQLDVVGNNIPRIDYDPATGACRGLLVEERRTNLITQSNLVGWGGPAVITQNATASPDGQMNGVLVDNFTNGNKLTSVSLVSGSTYTVSGYVKRGSSAAVGFDVNGVAVASGSFNFDTLATANCTAVSVGNGWYRIAYQITASSTGTANIYVYGNGGFVSPPGQTYWFGMQVEQGSFPTSYIPTSGAAATRAADVASINTLSPWFNSAEGTLFAEFDGLNASAKVVQFNPVAVGSFLTLANAGGAPNGWYANGLSVAGHRGVGTNNKSAIVYAPNGVVAASINAGAVASSTSSDFTGAATSLALGSQDGGAFLNGHIRAIQYIPKRLTDAQLQAMTA